MSVFNTDLKQALDDQVLQSSEAMILAGEWPSKKAMPQKKIETPEFSAKIFYNKETEKWIANLTIKATGETGQVEADTLAQLTDIAVLYQGILTVKNAEIETENRRIEQGLTNDALPWITSKEDFQGADDAREAYMWGVNYREGQDYFAMIEELKPKEREKVEQILHNSLEQLGLSITQINLCAAYRHAFDESQAFALFFQTARERREEKEARDVADQEQHRLAEEAQAEEIRQTEAWQAQEFPKLERKEAVRLAHEDLKELRRRAIPSLSGKRVETIPSPGTVIRK